MIFGDVVLLLFLSIAMTLAYPIKVAIQSAPENTLTPAPIEDSTKWKTGFEVEVTEPPIKGPGLNGFVGFGLAAERSVSEQMAIRATLMGNGISLGLPIKLLGSFNAWKVPWEKYPAQAEYAYLFMRPEIGYRQYSIDTEQKIDADESADTKIRQGSAGVSLGSGYRLPSSSSTHYWVQSWIGYRAYTNYLAYRASPGAVFGFDIGAEF